MSTAAKSNMAKATVKATPGSGYVMSANDRLIFKLCALESLLCNTYGEAQEAFLNMSGELIDNYLAHCAELATECKELAEQVNAEARGAGRLATQGG